MNSITLLIILGLLSPAQQANAAPEQFFTHEVPIRLVHLQNGRWQQKNIDENIKIASELYAQCGVRLAFAEVTSVSHPGGEVMFDLEGYSDPLEPREQNGGLALAKKYSRPDAATVFFIDSFDPQFGSISATAVPEVRVLHPDQKPAQNTVWLTYRAEIMRLAPPAEGGVHSGYNILAHELGHVLLNSDHVTEHYVHNLMHESAQNRNGRLTRAQCEKIKNSKLAHPIPLDKSSPHECPGAQSPLRGQVFFLRQSTKDCSRLNDLLILLENVQDAVSDLQPVFALDFYLQHPTNLIRYLDRRAFEGSLFSTYDALGKIPLASEQSDVLWMHELGHAIFGNQLATDWAWYQKRDGFMKKWGEAVAKATRLEETSKPRDEELSQIINEQIRQIGRLPNSKPFEDILAPYHELFADAVAVVYTMDPLALKKALANPKDPLGREATSAEKAELEERDYSYKRNVQTWYTAEAHALFTPTLAHVWDLIRNLKPEERTQQEILRRIYNAIHNEISERTANPKLWEITTPEANARLIARMSSL